MAIMTPKLRGGLPLASRLLHGASSHHIEIPQAWESLSHATCLIRYLRHVVTHHSQSPKRQHVSSSHNSSWKVRRRYSAPLLCLPCMFCAYCSTLRPLSIRKFKRPQNP
ncbi:hypothetical protein B0T10DRAFT_460381 [Thelonectria olida]|uniref:Uncharacterized protein n=1 Tax=Thelonectria olida TaxID=1576542 RepID=A0A9P9AS22_9HYPO|nr:hypothetical protein B0T10DRAFT_460381 [Thelonectria olida]